MQNILDPRGQEPGDFLHSVNESIANLRFRLNENCRFKGDCIDCATHEECDLHKDYLSFSSVFEQNPNLLDLVMDYPFLSQKMVEVFYRLSYGLRILISGFGDFKSKTRQEVDFLTSIEIDKNSKIAGTQFDRKGAANYLVGNYQEAILCFNEAIEIIGEKPSILFRRGEAKYKLSLNKEAEQDFERALQLNAEVGVEEQLDVEDLGTAKLRLGRFENAKEDFLRVLELNPNHADANCRLGEIYASQQNSRESLIRSLDFFELAIRTNGQHEEARFEMALALLRLSILIAGKTTYLYLESARSKLRTQQNYDPTTQKSALAYCQQGLDQIQWLIERVENDFFLLPDAKALKLGRLYLVKGILFKLIGDNSQSSNSVPETGYMRENAIKNLEACQTGCCFKNLLGELIYDIVNFKKLSEDHQKIKASGILNKFNQLISKIQVGRSAERRKIITAAADFFASLGSFKTAEQFVQKLESLELRSGIRDSKEYCGQLQNKHQSLQHEMYKAKVKTESLLYYLEAEKQLTNSVNIYPSGKAYLSAAVICLSIADLISKLRESYLEKAKGFVDKGLANDPENNSLLKLLEDSTLQWVEQK